jgi:hypothetical protein
VLACLQSPIDRDQIVAQVTQSSRKAILRLTAFRMIELMLEKSSKDVGLIEIVSWFVSF